MILILGVSGFTYANKFAEYDEVTLIDALDNSQDNYKTVNIRVDGEDVLADVPAIIYPGNRTLVPISFITEKIGAQIQWRGESKEVTITHENKTIVLKINSKTAYVNGKAITLPSDVPAKLMTFDGLSRTMVPAAFVSNQLGYDIDWDGATRTVSINKPRQDITSVRYVDAGAYPQLRFKVTGEVSMTSFSVDGKSVGGSDALILDFHNTDLNLTTPLTYSRFIINDTIQEVYDVKFEIKEGPPKGVKAIVDLGYYRHGEVFYDSSTKEMVVELINAVNYVDVETINQATAVVIDTTENPAYNLSYENDKVIVDIIHSKLKEEGGLTSVGMGGIKTISSQQIDNSSIYDQGTRFSRIAVTLDNNMTKDNVFVESMDSKIYVYVQESLFGTYSYARNLDNGISQFGVNINTQKSYPIDYNDALNRLYFSVPIDDTQLTSGEEVKDDGVVKTIKVFKNNQNNSYDITIDLAEGTTYQSRVQGSSLFQLVFTNKALQQSEYRDKLVVIDAGHGGHDPGASYGDLKEKDINLTTALALKRKLENAGFKVYMTRERDNYVQLYDRAAIANQLNADLFISIHANAARNTAAKGVETLYAPDASRNNLNFARVIQSGLLLGTGGVDRGVVSRPELVVIRETKMDAVLVEIGFLTNEDDYIKLKTNSYLEKAADGIFRGVLQYLD